MKDENNGITVCMLFALVQIDEFCLVSSVARIRVMVLYVGRADAACALELHILTYKTNLIK